MADVPKQTHLRLKSLEEEFKELRGEIGDIHNLLQTRHQRGENTTALIRIEGEKLVRAFHVVDEFIRLTPL